MAEGCKHSVQGGRGPGANRKCSFDGAVAKSMPGLGQLKQNVDLTEDRKTMGKRHTG